MAADNGCGGCAATAVILLLPALSLSWALSHGLLSSLPAAVAASAVRQLLRELTSSQGHKRQHPDGHLRLPGDAGSSSPTALTGRAGKLRRTAWRSGPAGLGLMALMPNCLSGLTPAASP